MNNTTLNALAGFPEQLEAHYAAIPGEFLNWGPPSWDGIPSEHFTPIEQVCHVRDIEIDGYHVRLQRASALVTGSPDFPLAEIPFQDIVDRVAAGIYKAKPARVFGFADIQEAHRLMESNQANGKLVVRL
jgi:zinc-binding alcohol dehydrogenase family protein